MPDEPDIEHQEREAASARRLTSVQPVYTGINMIAANVRKDLWRGSEIDGILGEGSVMFAGGGKTVFTQRCNHDLILLYFSLKVAEEWQDVRLHAR